MENDRKLREKATFGLRTQGQKGFLGLEMVSPGCSKLGESIQTPCDSAESICRYSRRCCKRGRCHSWLTPWPQGHPSLPITIIGPYGS